MLLFIGLPIISSFFQSLHIEPEQILMEVEKCDPFGCKTETKVDTEWIKEEYTGDVNFYTLIRDDEETEYIFDFKFSFKNGKLDTKELLRKEYLASKEERENMIDKIKAKPCDYIAQPLEILSTNPTISEEGIEPRHLDLRPFVLTGKKSWVTTGGLTRVALKKGSTIVNSSQGGGSKDTLVIER